MADTIYAVSSGHPPAAIAVMRLTGPQALAAASILAGDLPAPRHAGLRALHDAGGNLLDRALVLVFLGPRSATGEDLVEFHLHGGRAVVAAVAGALGSIAGLRPAEAGEFTRRALINGRIDLAEAEGLADLLSAETEGQRVAALNMAEGILSTRARRWFDRIAMLSAEVEAMLDFSDEDDVPDGEGSGGVLAAMTALAGELEAILAEPPVERLRDGVRIVLAGPPNSGKSTLFNILAQRDAAIVSPIAGTTRDRIEVPIARDGIAYILIDTAGLATDTDDEIEAIGIGIAGEAIAAADLLLWLGDDAPPRADAIWIHARADLPDRSSTPSGLQAVARGDQASITRLWQLVAKRATALLPRVGMVAMNARQRACMKASHDSLMTQSDDLLILAEHLRRARLSLAALLGLDATEAMLDALFGRFCIGK